MRSDHKWSFEAHVETHSNARCEETDIALSTTRPMKIPGVNRLSEHYHSVRPYNILVML